MKGFSRLLSSGGICLILFLIVSTQAHADTSLLQRASSYSVTGSPTVSAEFINQVLAANHSPAAGKGQALFDDGVSYGIDPVFALAFFMHESSFGTTGIAQYTLSLGNERCIAGFPCYNGFTVFPSWEAGFIGWYSLIRNLYVETWNLSTVEEIIPVYAPASDHNDVSGYINAVDSAVDAWRSGQISAFGSVSGISSISPLALSTTGTPYRADQYSIVGKPTVTVAFINQILTQYHSPAIGKGQLFYDAGVKYGIDPIYALAFFMRDSTFGTVGLARATRSLGPLPMSDTATACHCQGLQGYRSYASWDASITDWFHYMHDYYVKQMGLTTVSQIVSIYLRTNDSLAIQFAIKAIESRVDLWRKPPKQTPLG
nr:hypothetical protein [Ktedonobacteraceae bacterium]